MSKSSFYEMFATDSALEKNGIALDYGEAGTIVIARAGGSNTKFQTRFQALMRPYRMQMQNGTMDDDVANRLMAEAFAETVVLGWSGVKGSDGEELEFTQDNVKKLLTDLPELFADIRTQATSFTNFVVESREEDAKS